MDKNRHDQERKVLLVWPRQIGKDTSCFAYMVKEACQVSGNYFYIFPTAEEAKRALWKKVMDDGEKLLDLLPEECIGRISNQDMSLEIDKKVCGVSSTIQVIGLDRNPNAIRGSTPMGVVLSEFAFSDIEAYRTLLPAMRRKGCWHIINSTPNGRNHFYSLYQGAKGSDEWFTSYLQALYPDKPNYIHIHDKKYFETQVKQGMTTWEDIEREYGCSFSTGMKGAFYADFLEDAWKEGRITDVVYDGITKVDTFWDLGVDDSTAIWFRQLDGNRIIWIDYFEDSGKDIAYYVKILKSKGYNYRTHHLPHDGANRSIQTQYRTDELFRICCTDAGISSDTEVSPRMGLQDGINAVRSRFSKFFFNEGTTFDGIQKLGLYHRRWDPKRQVFLKEPVHDWTSHAADAIRTEATSEEYADELEPSAEVKRAITDFDLFDDD